ncbi:MAG: DNA translocase FtsK [Rikenellaceae bacterium]
MKRRDKESQEVKTPKGVEQSAVSEIDFDSTTSSSVKIRWVIGLLVILIGIYATLSVIQHIIHWKADMDLLMGLSKDHPDFDSFSYGNICGGLGARIGNLLTGGSFGIAGVIIPIYFIIFGVNLMRGSKRLILNRDTLTMFIILILTSLTFGTLFGESWSLFGSGLGGSFGIAVSKMLREIIDVGIFLLLIGLWAATGVFINSNFINIVNKAGSSALSKTDKLASMLKRNISTSKEAKMEEDVAEEHVEEGDKPQEADTIISEVEDEPIVTNSITINDLYKQGGASQLEEIAPIIEDVKSESKEVVEIDDDPFIEVIGPKTPEKNNEAKNSNVSTNLDFEIVQPEPTDKVIGLDEEFVTNGGEHQVLLPSGGTVVFVEVNESKSMNESEIEPSIYDPTKDINNFIAPPIALLEEYQSGSDVEIDKNEIYENKSQIEETLSHFGIPIQQIKATVGPTITLYEIVQANGVKISKIQGLENDIAQSLKALGIRIIAPIPGKGTIGIEVPNRTKKIVSMRSAIRSEAFQEVKAQLPIVIGRTIQNENYVFDLAKMPHLLVAGATGQGKSVGLNAIITSLLYRKHPSELKFVMIDPKMVEFTPYKHLEFHYMAKMESEEDVIITDPKKAVYALNAICEEMESRLKLLSQAGVRNIVEYNDKFKRRVLNPEKGHFFMPYIVVVIDEFADLIMTAKEVEMPVMRIAQKARAVGIHLIVATQRPDVKVITGGIKANFPARIAFKVTQMIDSRTIIDQPGANQLIGRGDMLFSKDGELTRIQCALVETEEVARIVEHISKQQGYSGAYRLPDYTPEGSGDFDMGSNESGPAIKYDPLFTEIARAAVSNGGISTSAIQRNFEVGFNRAGRIMTQLERAGIVGRQEGSKPRDILFYDMPSLEAKFQELGLF